MIFKVDPQRSTVDNLVGLETFVRDSFVRILHAVTVFFDLENVMEVWCPIQAWSSGSASNIHSEFLSTPKIQGPLR